MRCLSLSYRLVPSYCTHFAVRYNCFSFTVFHHKNKTKHFCNTSFQLLPTRMEAAAGNNSNKNEVCPHTNSTTPPNVSKIQQLINNDSTGGWDKCWEQSLTPWDLGRPTPIVLHLLQTGALPAGRVLVPGCGSGHDVIEIAGPERYVVGLDVSENAIKKAREVLLISISLLSPSPYPDADIVRNCRFFCAIEPSMRPAWASRVHDLLKPDGELITLMFPVDDRIGGPPYKVSLPDYEEVLHPMGFKAVCVEDNELAVGGRKGIEKLGRWKRSLGQSQL
ncbi:hypothetical protein IFM89_038842 [Coptis chinensis]|uniref:Thiol methyltransferase 2 n=1 Tax=Coptis chinensis TaxID=261450 RepID=A0A835I8T8_9MAGN|nr:hypothetical protein IFM89_038842 [Coptis chinensis]